MGDGLRQQAGGAERGPPAPLRRRVELGADAPALAGEGRGVASIKDIARLAGVSVSTVSRVFSDHWLVGEATRAKLKGAIAATNYRPNTICELSDPTLTTVASDRSRSGLATKARVHRGGRTARPAPTRSVRSI